jgi:hypothetical protein
MKKYMVLKMVSAGLKGMLQIVPLVAMVPLPEAEESVRRLTEEEPDSVFLIQEVGLA